MQIKTLILALMISTSAFAEEEASCMDQAQYLAVGLKLTEHLLYMVEHTKKDSIESLCAQPFRTKFFESDLKIFNQPLIQARIDLEERGITSSKNFPYLRRSKVEMVNMKQVCEMVETHLKKNNRCMEPEEYMRRLMTKKILSNSFEENCNKYLSSVVSNTGQCLKK